MRFGEAGSVTVRVDVRWLDLPDEVFIGLRKVIQDLEKLEALVIASGAGTDESDNSS